MNNARNSDRLERAFLKLNKSSTSGNKSTLRGELFDGSPFELTLHNYEFEDQGPDCPVLLEVAYVGANHSIAEILLPAPVLNYGCNIRVNPSSLIKWAEYQLIQEKKRNV